MVKKIWLILVTFLLFTVKLHAFSFKAQGKLSMAINGIVVLGIIATVVYMILKKKDEGGEE